MTTTSLWMTVNQVAEQSGRNPYSVREALRRGVLAGAQSHAKARWRISAKAFATWMEAGAPLDRPVPRRLRRMA